jgi:proteasome lid subunit RPN8/RPN11
MTAKPAPLEIPGPILAQVYAEARRAFPFECCGWLAGARDGASVSVVRRCINAQDSGNHPTKPDRGAEAAYVFSGPDLLDLNRSLDTEQPPLIIYHSHPNGQAYLSETDRSVATSPWGEGPAYPVQQLVVGIDDQRVVAAALFAWADREQDFVEIARYAGAEV